MKLDTIYQGNALNILKTFPNQFVNCIVTSPPYYRLRDYNCDGQIGLEDTPEKYVENMVKIFRECKRVLKDDGTLWLNLGDNYTGSGKGENQVMWTGRPGAANYGHTKQIFNGLKPKNLIGIPWRVAFALQADDWYLRSDIIWAKGNPMPESVVDRPTKSHEYIFLLSKSQKYYYDNISIMEKANYDGRIDTIMKGSKKYKNCILPNAKLNTMAIKGHERWKIINGQKVRNKRTVWKVNTKPYLKAHFAVYPEKLIEPCIKAGCPENGIVLDLFMGAGTTGLVVKKLNRHYIGIELNPEYIELAKKRIKQYTDQGRLF